ncbi:MAG: ATP-binding protein [Sphingomonas sp.]|uniref:sensor histidine kinase NtrY-like n=1 Tax=Sphingomonas sp. TaxID=28214 RepID=UPI003F813396
MSGDSVIAAPRRVWGGRFHITPAMELGVLALAVAVGIATYFVVRAGAAPQRLLTPPLVALLLVVNLGPCVALIMLLGRRIAKTRAARSGAGGEGRLHVRLVALFSTIATVPTVLAVIFASVMFQYGVEFWLSDRVSGVLKDATALAQESYEQSLSRWNEEALATAGDLSANFSGLSTTADPAALLKLREPTYGLTLPNYLSLQLLYRNLAEGALFTVKGKNDVQFIARVDPYGNVAEQIDPIAVASVLKGERSVVTVRGNRVRVLTLVPGSKQLFLYAGKVTEGPLVDRQSARVADVVTNFKALQSRARALQLQFNAALFVVALLIVGIAVWIALVVADRLVRPVGEMVAAARRVADGDLTARVPDPRSDDEVGTLANAFNRMTSRLQEQTGALESRRALIEAVMSGVSAGVISVSGDGTIRLINASAVAQLRLDEAKAVGAQLADLAPELADLLAGDARESILQLTTGGEARTLAVRITADEDGRVLTFDDITQQLLDQRRAAWSDVARRIAHEIKNPLTPIQLAAERLQRRYGKTIEDKDGVFAQLTDTIVRQVGDLRRMVDEFSSFARMPKPVFNQESLIDLARQALFLHEVAHPDIAFRLEAPDAAPLVCDRRQIGQALTNIVKNAVEAIEARNGHGAPGEITMTLDHGERLMTATIADNGIGLPLERDRIVEPYMTTRARGTGLGLAIVKKIIEEHCGTIAFADRPGGGTIVTIVFDTLQLDALLDENRDPAETSQGEGALAMLTRTGHKS